MKIEDFKEVQKKWKACAAQLADQAAIEAKKAEDAVTLAAQIEQDLLRLHEMGSNSYAGRDAKSALLVIVHRNLRDVIEAETVEDFKRLLQELGVNLLTLLKDNSFDPVVSKELKDITMKIISALISKEPAHGN